MVCAYAAGLAGEKRKMLTNVRQNGQNGIVGAKKKIMKRNENRIKKPSRNEPAAALCGWQRNVTALAANLKKLASKLLTVRDRDWEGERERKQLHAFGEACKWRTYCARAYLSAISVVACAFKFEFKCCCTIVRKYIRVVQLCSQ